MAVLVSAGSMTWFSRPEIFWVSEFYTDVHLSFSMNPDREGFRFTVGANNIFDNDPAVCLNTCGSTNMSAVVHDLPGTVAYFKVSYLH